MHWGVAYHSQPLWTQHISLCLKVLHGDPHLYSPGSSQRLVDVVSLDIKDAYLHVSILPSWWYLQLAPRNPTGELVVYQWESFPFWPSHYPQKFYQTHLHLQGCLMHPYSDGIFHAQMSANQAAHTRNLTLCWHSRLGLCKPPEVDPHPVSGDAPSQGFDWHAIGMIFPSLTQTRDDCACSSGVARSHPGFNSMPLTGD